MPKSRVSLSVSKLKHIKQDTNIVSETGEVRYKELMKKFYESKEVKCKSVKVDIPREDRQLKEFCTGSKYEGMWNFLGMSGYGTYTFPHGVIYEGDTEDGLFNGEGEFRYDDGIVLRGKFVRGRMIENKLFYTDGLEYAENDWKYCQMPDRRYTYEYEIQVGVQPAGLSFITSEFPDKEVPSGYYDTGDGYFDRNTHVIYKYSDLTAIVRAPTVPEVKWILANCRCAPSTPLGPRPALYEEWLQPVLDPPAPPSPAALTKLIDDDIYDEDQSNEFRMSISSWKHARFSECHTWRNRSMIKFQF